MSFESVLNAATDLLRRRRRITLSLLRREFSLDAETLEDLKNELVLAQRVARVEDDVVLVWVEEATAPATAPAPTAGAERRNLTVMFCDLVGSTRLSARLDPEDLRELVRRYHETCAAVLRPAGGHIAQYLGDGLMVYFGFPVANEDDAERAVRAGLAIVRAVQDLGAQQARQVPDGLAARVGIHTGLVVVGELGAASVASALALGEAPNLAAHIQGAAQPGQVLVSQATLDLLPPRFDIEPLGPVVLKDPSRPVRLARVRGEREAAAAAPRTVLDPLGHLAALREAWAAVQAGQTRSLVLEGEPGLGKTTLTDALVAEARAAGAAVRVLRCSAFHSQTVLHPLAHLLLQRAGLNPDAPGPEAAQRLEARLRDDGVHTPDLRAPLALLLGADPGPGAPPPAVLMQQLQALLAEWLAGTARDGPGLLVWEDVHWADPTSLAVLQRLLGAAPVPRLMNLLSTRPQYVPAHEARAALPRRVLVPMDQAAIEQLAQRTAGTRALPPALLARIVALAEGVPLYAEQITRAALESGDADAAIDLPATLQATLTARLDRLGPVKEVAQVAALLGRDFSADLLGAVTALAPPALADALDRLVGGDVLQPVPDSAPARYAFRHALLQAAASDSLLRAARRGAHERIAQVLLARFPDAVELAPEILAGHWSAAGRVPEAVAQWHRAGERALARSAVAEAAAHLRSGLSLVDELPERQDGAPVRDAQELALLIPLASALRAGQGVGAPDTGAAYERAVVLAEALGDRRQLIPALNGLYSFLMVSGRFADASVPAQKLLDAASAGGDALFEMIGLRAVGAMAFHMGEPRKAREHLERGLAMYVAERHAPLAVTLGIDHGVMSSNFLGLTLWQLDEEEAARRLLRRNLAWAVELDHAHSHAQALTFGAMLVTMLEDWPAAAELGTRGAALSRRLGFSVLALACEFFAAYAQAQQLAPAELAAPLARMQQAAQAVWATGTLNYRPLLEMQLARVLARCGQADAARAMLAAAFQTVALSGERWIEPELWRLRADLEPAQAQAHLRRALAVARAQRATRLVRLADEAIAARGRDDRGGARGSGLVPGGC